MTMVTDFDPAIANQQGDEDDVRKYGLNRREDEHIVFRFRRGSAVVETTLDNDALANAKRQGIPAVQFRAKSISPGRSEDLSRVVVNGKVGGLISGPTAVPPDWTLDVGLGLRLLGASGWLDISDLTAAERSSDAENSVTLVLNDHYGLRHELTFNKSVGYALVRYRRKWPTKAEPYELIECSDFRRIGGVFVPYLITRFNIYRDSVGELRQPITRNFKLLSFVFDAQAPTTAPEPLMITWPGGATVRDMRTEVMIPVGPTSRPLTDAEIAEEIILQEGKRTDLEKRARDRIDRNLDGSRGARQ
jgi:hypothetical protein